MPVHATALISTRPGSERAVAQALLEKRFRASVIAGGPYNVAAELEAMNLTVLRGEILSDVQGLSGVVHVSLQIHAPDSMRRFHRISLGLLICSVLILLVTMLRLLPLPPLAAAVAVAASAATYATARLDRNYWSRLANTTASSGARRQ
jgi:hypothetical protein